VIHHRHINFVIAVLFI